MIKLKPLLSESSKILVPRRTPEEREKRWVQETYRKIQDYIKNGCEGVLNLSHTPIKILPNNLKRVGGELKLMDSKIEDFNNLEYIGGNLYCAKCKNLTSIGKLKYISGCGSFFGCENIKSLNDLEFVDSMLDLDNTGIESLGNIKRINGHLYIQETKNLISMGKLQYVKENIYAHKSNILTVMPLKEIKKNIKIGGDFIIAP